jgi:N-acetyl-anhydromuramyl-L-alanine amidase AmpD
MTGNAIICAGEPVYVGKPVRVWTDTGLTFAGLKPRKRTRFIVSHWTGGAGLAVQVHRTLRTRKNERGQLLNLSVHFLIEPDGTIVQYVDADMRCVHAGAANDDSVGIEVVNPASMAPVVAGVRRELIREEIHGRDVTYTAFTVEQVSSTIALNAALTKFYGLPWPMRVPMDGKRVRSTTMPLAEFETFVGSVGHYHVDFTKPLKRDPGVALMRAIAAHENVLREPAEDVA